MSLVKWKTKAQKIKRYNLSQKYYFHNKFLKVAIQFCINYIKINTETVPDQENVQKYPNQGLICQPTGQWGKSNSAHSTDGHFNWFDNN